MISLQYLFDGHDSPNQAPPKAEQDWVYLIHHMHQPEKENQIEDLHHCFLFSEKGLKGTKYEQEHKKEGKVFLHVLKLDKMDSAPSEVFDHLNNSFKIKVRNIDGKDYAVIDGLTSIKDTKWSAQDKK